MHKTSGMTLIEILLVSFLGGIIAVLSAYCINLTIRQYRENDALSQRSLEVASALQFILRIGRTANSCQVPSAGTLECEIDRERPAQGNISQYRFIVGGTGLEVYTYDNVNSAWVLHRTFLDITGFNACDGTLMNSGCTIQPPGLNTFGANRNRYFRVWLSQVSEEQTRELTSAFFIRNPTPFGNEVVYQW